MLFYGVPPTCVRTCAYTLWPVCRIYYVVTPIRVGIHICVGAGKRIVDIQTALLTLSTPTKYIQISYRIKNGPHKGGLFPFYPFWKKKHKAATFFFKKPFWVWKVYMKITYWLFLKKINNLFLHYYTDVL